MSSVSLLAGEEVGNGGVVTWPLFSKTPIMSAVKRARRGVGNCGLRTRSVSQGQVQRSMMLRQPTNIPRVGVETEVLGNIGCQARCRRGATKILGVEIVNRVPVKLLAEAHGGGIAGGIGERVCVRARSKDVPAATPRRDGHWAVQSCQRRGGFHGGRVWGWFCQATGRCCLMDDS
jgi:hypothetical protein